MKDSKFGPNFKLKKNLKGKDLLIVLPKGIKGG